MIQVLVVDGDIRVAEAHAIYIDSIEGFSVLQTARTLIEARSLAQELKPGLIVLDLNLADRDGIDLLQATTGTAIDVIVTSSDSDAATVARCANFGAVQYLIKPFTRVQFEHRLHAYRLWKAKTSATGQLSQGMVDLIIDGPRAVDATLPKGLSASTMDLVVTCLSGADSPLSSEDVATETGVSRVSVRRYLRHLADVDRAELVQDYGVPGRPLHRFRLVH